jgi:hypothetical protein
VIPRPTLDQTPAAGRRGQVIREMVFGVSHA